MAIFPQICPALHCLRKPPAYTLIQNLRFREESLTFRIAEAGDDFSEAKNGLGYSYPKMKKKLGNFDLTVEAGEFTDSEILVLLGENGTGKT